MTLRRESFNVCSSSLTSGASAQFASWVPARLSWLREGQGTSGEGGGLFLGWFCPASGSVSGWGLVFFFLYNFGACFRAEFREVLTRAGCFRRLAPTIGSTFIFLAHASPSFSASSDAHFRVALIRSVRRAPVCLFNAVVQQTNSM